MNRTGALLGCFLLWAPLGYADNSLLLPASERCSLQGQTTHLAQARSVCESAAQAGDSHAYYELGEYYYQGLAGTTDFAQALYYFEQASLKGHAKAQLRLGTMYSQGQGVTANALQAYIVLKMAAVNGEESALDNADQVEQSLPEPELTLAKQVLGQIFRSYMQGVAQTEPGAR